MAPAGIRTLSAPDGADVIDGVVCCPMTMLIAMMSIITTAVECAILFLRGVPNRTERLDRFHAAG